MSVTQRAVVLGGLVVSCLLVEAGAAEPAPSREDYRGRYGVLSEHNIFLRDRGRRRQPEQPTSRPVYTPPPVEDSFVLRGVVWEDGAYRAYVESLAGGTVLKLGVGDAVAGGRVASIEMDAIEYEQVARKPARIEIGQTLSGGDAVFSRSSASSLPESTTQPSGPPIDPNNPNLTIEEKMRLRRMQELNRK